MKTRFQAFAFKFHLCRCVEESKKCVLATITLHYMNDGDSKSSGEAKVRAGETQKKEVPERCACSTYPRRAGGCTS